MLLRKSKDDKQVDEQTFRWLADGKKLRAVQFPNGVAYVDADDRTLA